MIKSLARWWARRSYIWKLEKKAGEEELNAKLSALHAEQKRKDAEKLNAEADAIEKSVKEYAEKEERGFWRCENGHEFQGEAPAVPSVCPDCSSLTKYVKRSEMTGQEQYESDKERKDAEQMVKNHRERVTVLEKEVTQHEQTVQHFQREATRSHSVAEEVRQV